MRQLIKTLPPSFFAATALMCGILATYQKLFLIMGSIVILIGAGIHKRHNYSLIFISSISMGWGIMWAMINTHTSKILWTNILNQRQEIEGIIEQSIHSTTYNNVIIAIEHGPLKGKRVQAFLPSTFSHLVGKKIIIPPVIIRSLYKKPHDLSLLRDNLIGILFPKNITISPHHLSWWQRIRLWPAQVREYLVQSSYKYLPSSIAALFNSLFLGASQDLSLVRNYFNRWGIAHYLARSGLHITLIISMWSLGIRFIPLYFKGRMVILTLLLLFFYAFSFSSVSFARALTGYLLSQYIVLQALPLHGISIVCATCWLVLAYNPFHIYFLSFQLSFFLAFSIAWIYEFLKIKSNS